MAIHIFMSYPNLFSGVVLLSPMCDIAKKVTAPAMPSRLPTLLIKTCRMASDSSGQRR